MSEEIVEEHFLLSVHLLGLVGLDIVMAHHMQQAVGDVEHQFPLNTVFSGGSFADSHIGANDELCDDTIGQFVRQIEADNIRSSLVIQVLAVCYSHLLIVDEGDIQLGDSLLLFTRDIGDQFYDSLARNSQGVLRR